tara:strand:- start:508 stop:825 length:318 start_codon:yes stop_codon:yes gene_type:complete
MANVLYDLVGLGRANHNLLNTSIDTQTTINRQLSTIARRTNEGTRSIGVAQPTAKLTAKSHTLADEMSFLCSYQKLNDGVASAKGYLSVRQHITGGDFQIRPTHL